MSDDSESRDDGSESGKYRQSNAGTTDAEPWRDPDRLATLYHVDGLSQYEIADRFDTSQSTIQYWMEKYEIESRPSNREKEADDPWTYKDEKGGTMYLVKRPDGGRRCFFQHQLAALLEFAPHVVFDPDTSVHHELASPDAVDTVENLDVIGRREHSRLHAGGAYDPDRDEILSCFREWPEDSESAQSEETPNTTTAEGIQRDVAGD